MSEQIVDRLEAVDVGDDQRGLQSRAPIARKRVLEALVKPLPVH
jgi:hypothetical protein